ncbi:MAG: hypothetical protein P4L61_02610 [Candidatus Pacebacteria bacterium]|nr:hypothetical protein [Candidatus Paceibacterota bacterium]
MKIKKNLALKTEIAMLSGLAVMFAPLMEAHAAIASSYTIVVSSNNADAAAALRKSDLEVANSLPSGYSIDRSVIIMTSVSSTNAAAINAAIAGALAGQPTPEFVIPAAACIVAAAVIVVGTIIIIKLYYLCKKLFPDPPADPTNTNSPTDQVRAEVFKSNGSSGTQTASDTNVYAAWIVVGRYIPEQCDCGSDTNGALDIPYSMKSSDSASDPSGSLGQPTWTAPSQGIGTNELANRLQKLGLTFSSTSSSYSSNGIPVSSLPNICYFAGVLTVKIGNLSSTNTAVFQRTPVLGGSATYWVPFFTNTVIGGSARGIVTDSDAPPGSGYYRMVMTSP